MDDKIYRGPGHPVGAHFHSGPKGERGLPGVSPKVDMTYNEEDGQVVFTVTDGYGQREQTVPMAELMDDWMEHDSYEVLKQWMDTHSDAEWWVDENHGLHLSNVPPDADDRIVDAVDDWLDDHPEATTTVQDGSITVEKFASSVVDDTLTEEGHPADAKKVGDLVYMGATQEVATVEKILTLTRQKTYLQAAEFDGEYIYWVDFNSNSDCDLVKSRMSDGEEVLRKSVQDYTNTPVHGNGIAYCELDENIYLTDTDGNGVHVIKASDLSFVKTNYFRSKLSESSGADPNNAIAWNSEAGVFATNRSYSNEIELYTFEQVTSTYYRTHCTLPYKRITKFRSDLGSLCGTQQNIEFYKNFLLIPQDRHSGKQHNGMTVLGTNGAFIKDIVFANDPSGKELEAVISDNESVYAVYADGSVYQINLTNILGGTLISWGGSVALSSLSRNYNRYATIYDAHETAVASGVQVSSGTVLTSDVPASYDSAIHASNLIFYVETDGYRAIPITFKHCMQSFEHGLAQTRRVFGSIPNSASNYNAEVMVIIEFHFVKNGDKMNIYIDGVSGKTKQTDASTGLVSYSNLANLRIDGVVAEFA